MSILKNMGPGEPPAGFRDNTSFFFPMESHKPYEIAIQLTGSSIIECSHKKYTLSPNQILLINTSETHRLGVSLNQQSSPMSILWVLVAPDSIRPSISTYDKSKRQKVWAIQINKSAQSIVDEIFLELKKGLNPESLQAISLYLSAFLTIVVRHLSFSKRIWDSGKKTLIVKQLKDYISENVYRTITLDELAKLASVSPNYLCVIFKQITGDTLFDYIMNAKVHKALDFLTDTDKKLSEIAEDLGFCDQFHFSKSFKKVIGISPSEYRSTYRPTK